MDGPVRRGLVSVKGNKCAQRYLECRKARRATEIGQIDHGENPRFVLSSRASVGVVQAHRPSQLWSLLQTLDS